MVTSRRGGARVGRGRHWKRGRLGARAFFALLGVAALVALPACGSGENVPEGASSALEDILTGTLPEGGGGIDEGEPVTPSEEPPAEEPPAEPAAAGGEETAAESDDGGSNAWIWAVIAAAAVIAVVLLLVARRRKGGPEARSLVERQQILVAAIGGWTAQGWLVESQATVEAVLRRGAERHRLSVDENGTVLQEALPPHAAPPPPTSAGGEGPPSGSSPPPGEPDEPGGTGGGQPSG